jgi:hypothetical protein
MSATKAWLMDRAKELAESGPIDQALSQFITKTCEQAEVDQHGLDPIWCGCQLGPSTTLELLADYVSTVTGVSVSQL